MPVPNQRIVKNITFQDINVVYDSYGVGDEALVFIHGWTCSRELWAAQSPLYENHRSILIDLPGHGDSDSPEIDYHIELFARAVAAVVQQENIKKVLFIAHSMGGPVATMLVRLFNSSNVLTVSGIVYVDSFFHLPEHYMSVEQRRGLRERLNTDDDGFVANIRLLLTTHSTDEKVRDNVQRVMLATPRHVRASATTSLTLPHAMAYDEVYQHIPAVNITAICPPAHGHWFHHFPRLEIRAMTGVGHWLFMDKPEEFNTMVDSFLKQISYYTP